MLLVLQFWASSVWEGIVRPVRGCLGGSELQYHARTGRRQNQQMADDGHCYLRATLMMAVHV